MRQNTQNYSTLGLEGFWAVLHQQVGIATETEAAVLRCVKGIVRWSQLSAYGKK